MRSRMVVPTLVLTASVALLAACSSVVPAATVAPTGKSVPGGEYDKRPGRSDDVLAELLDSGAPGCSAAVAVLGEVRWAGARGLADVDAGTPLTTATRFDIASISKQFTATAVLMLEREGLLSLDDTIGTYVDGLPTWGSSVTLEQLMHHTSHVRDYWQRLQGDGIAFEDHVSHEQTVQAIARLRTLEPGTGYLYSNSNYVLLAEVVQRVSGLPLPEFLDERIFTPLGLDLELSPNLVAPDVALSYDDDGSRQQPGWSAYGAVGIFATASELARWGDQYREGAFIADDAIEGAVDDGEGALYGAGITLDPDGSLSHTGRFGGHISTFEVSPDRETTIVVLCNGHAAPRFPIEEALWGIWAPPDA